MPLGCNGGYRDLTFRFALNLEDMQGYKESSKYTTFDLTNRLGVGFLGRRLSAFGLEMRLTIPDCG